MSEPRTRVLVVDDDPIVAGSLAEFLRAEGYSPAEASDADAALRALADAEHAPPGGDGPRPFDLVIADVSLPGMDGLELLQKVTRGFPGTAVLMLTAYGTIESAVKALKLGASDYLTKPVVDAELRLAVERALKHRALLAENQVLRRRLDAHSALAGIVGSDARMLKVFELIDAVAPSRTTVLMTGESGVGKSLVARAIHESSPRKSRPFVELSCGSIPETLLESELFGHVKGAFTGAHADKIGRFLAADGGTIFLDEINAASPAMQLKLLRVLQERKFEPVGSSQTVEADVRVVLATNQPLEGLVAAGLFRQDLYYRITVVTVELPPLRDRPVDIRPLAEHFLAHFARELGRQLAGFSPAALGAMTAYRFPGNVRELRNVVERAAVLARNPTIGIEDLPAHLADGRVPGLTLVGTPGHEPATDDAGWTPTPLEEALRDPERRIILRALKANGWNRQKTAEQLSINRTTLYKKMKSLGIEGGPERLAG
ncbi:MAG: sigma-54-dependent transcriptional regulator [Phycisphaerales bacterium]